MVPAHSSASTSIFPVEMSRLMLTRSTMQSTTTARPLTRSASLATCNLHEERARAPA